MQQYDTGLSYQSFSKQPELIDRQIIWQVGRSSVPQLVNLSQGLSVSKSLSLSLSLSLSQSLHHSQSVSQSDI